jgi:hypothetical protein
MDGRQTDYPQSGSRAPFQTFPEPPSEGSSADPASAAQFSQGPDPRAANFSSAATPTSEYGINPSSARSGSFPEYIQRAGGMAQSTSPSLPLPDGQDNTQHNNKSDSDVPIDPSIATASSPTYPAHQQQQQQPQYSPYGPQHDMQHYQGHPQTPMYGARPEWAGQYPPHHMQYGHPASSGPPAQSMVSPVQRPPAVRPDFNPFVGDIFPPFPQLFQVSEYRPRDESPLLQ